MNKEDKKIIINFILEFIGSIIFFTSLIFMCMVILAL